MSSYQEQGTVSSNIIFESVVVFLLTEIFPNKSGSDLVLHVKSHLNIFFTYSHFTSFSTTQPSLASL